MKGSIVAAAAALSGAVSAARVPKRMADDGEKCECTTRYETITGEPTCMCATKPSEFQRY